MMKEQDVLCKLGLETYLSRLQKALIGTLKKLPGMSAQKASCRLRAIVRVCNTARAALNEEGPQVNQDKEGLYQKYQVTKVDGSPIDPKAIYFVLRPDTDHHARIALRAYADSVKKENPKLSWDLRRSLYRLRCPWWPYWWLR